MKSILNWFYYLFFRPNLANWRRDSHDYILEFDNGTRYIGNCTVWHTLPSFYRCDTMTEVWLSGVVNRVKFEERNGVKK